jgi:hypothetical protein
VSAPTIVRPDGGAPEPERPPRKWVRYVIVLVCLPVLAMWIYALGFADKTATVHLDDTAWTERAEGICQQANGQRDALFDPRRIDDVGPDALDERAAIVDQATDILEHMLDAVVVVQPDSADDRALVLQWEGYYRTLIQDRRDYTARLRAGGPNRFDETVVDDQPLSSFLDDFALPNFMPSCVSPKDLG